MKQAEERWHTIQPISCANKMFVCLVLMAKKRAKRNEEKRERNKECVQRARTHMCMDLPLRFDVTRNIPADSSGHEEKLLKSE